MSRKNGKKHIFLVAILIAILSGAVFLTVNSVSDTGHSNKIIDPQNSKFSPENFRWDDYPDSDTFFNTLKILFPVGTDKSYVEKVLLADPQADALPPENLEKRKAKTGSYILGKIYDEILNRDPDFKSATVLVKYRNPLKKGSLTPTSRTITVFYSDEGKLLNLVLYNQIVHVLPPKTERN